MSGDYLWDFSGPRDPEIVRLERLLRPLAHRPRPGMALPPLATTSRLSRTFVVAAVSAAAAVTALVGATWVARSTPPSRWTVTAVTGAPTVASRPLIGEGALTMGHWLETDADGRASIAVASIGHVEVEPHTRVGLVRSSPGEYRLRLARGTVHAVIWSPPGQFFIDTPSSTAVDLGCAYTMSVDDDGVALVRVTSGWVGFEWRGREAFIPAGAVDVTRPGLGPGTPHYEDTSEAFRDALTLVDVTGGTRAQRAAAVTLVLAEARPKDAMSLWHLLTRVDTDERDRVFDRLASLAPPPPGVTREGIRAGNRDMLDGWWNTLGLGTTNWWRVWKQPWRDIQ